MEYTLAVINNDKSKLIAVATDGHRLCKTLIEVQDIKNFQSIILPKKQFSSY